MTGARLRLQTLPRQQDQVLVVAHLASLRGAGGTFSPADVGTLFDLLRVPAPKNPSDMLAKLARDRCVVRLGPGRWSLTPLGEHAVGEIAITWSSADLSSNFSSDFAQVTHHTIPAELAPITFIKPLEAFLDAFPFERNVFGISRYARPGIENDPIPPTFTTVRNVLLEYGLQFHLASDRQIMDQMWPNVAAFMWGCRYGLALVEDTAGEGVNTNVLIEVGGMQMTGRRCVLLKDESIEKMPSDLAAHIRKNVDLFDQSTVEASVRQWCEKDLMLTRGAV